MAALARPSSSLVGSCALAGVLAVSWGCSEPSSQSGDNFGSRTVATGTGASLTPGRPEVASVLSAVCFDTQYVGSRYLLLPVKPDEEALRAPQLRCGFGMAWKPRRSIRPCGGTASGSQTADFGASRSGISEHRDQAFRSIAIARFA